MSVRIDTPVAPNAPLARGEALIHSFAPCPEVFRRQQVRIAAAAMLAGMAVLWLLQNPYVWAGAPIGAALIVASGWVTARAELPARWDLTDRRLLGPGKCQVDLADIATLRTRGTTVQVLTRNGDRHLLKYQPNRDTTRLMIHAVMNGMRQ